MGPAAGGGADGRTRAALAVAMPGARSSLERHEWLKHGTCYGADPEEYFRDALLLLGQLNDSAVRGLLAGRIGGRITADQLAAAFDGELRRRRRPPGHHGLRSPGRAPSSSSSCG